EDAQRRPPVPVRHRLAQAASAAGRGVGREALGDKSRDPHPAPHPSPLTPHEVTRMKWETVIGLEVHTQLATQSKIFSGSSTAFGAAPNTQASAVDIALPGVLPVLNRGAVE